MEKIIKQLNKLTSEVKILTNKIKELEKRIPPTPKKDTRSDDELYKEVKKEVIKVGRVSTSYIQRKFGLGYARSACLMDMLEDNKIIGPNKGAGPRDVLIKK